MPFIGNKPSAVPLTSADITDNVITSAKIVDGTITNTDIASSIITGQTAETSIAGGDSILIYDDSASALRKMTRTNFVAGIGGTNTPAFMAYNSTNQTISHATYTKVQFPTELFDTDSAYDNATNYRFTIPTGKDGKYYIQTQIIGKSAGTFDLYYFDVQIRKNGTNFKNVAYFDNQTSRMNYEAQEVEVIMPLVATDYIEVFVYIEGFSNTGSPVIVNSETKVSSFQAFKLIE